MRQMISGLVAAAALIATSAAPAMACGGLFTGAGCSPCAAYSPCAQGYYPGYYGAGYGIAAYEHLPYLTQHYYPTQYYYVNQGPTFSGPGAFAPVPTYQEAAVSGWNAYSRPYYYRYAGGRYAHAMHHYYDGAPVTGPVVSSYRWHHARSHYGVYRHSLRYGHAPRHYGHSYGSRHHHRGHHHHSATHHHH